MRRSLFAHAFLWIIEALHKSVAPRFQSMIVVSSSCVSASSSRLHGNNLAQGETGSLGGLDCLAFDFGSLLTCHRPSDGHAVHAMLKSQLSLFSFTMNNPELKDLWLLLRTRNRSCKAAPSSWNQQSEGLVHEEFARQIVDDIGYNIDHELSRLRMHVGERSDCLY